MIEVWGRKNSSNVIPVLWTLGELQLQCTRHNVGGSFGGLQTDAYGALNPNRTIPTLDDGGFVVWESNTIIRYLSRTYGTGTLCPQDAKQAALADQWMEWYKSSLMMNLMQVFFGLVRTEPADRDPAVVEKLVGAVNATLQILNDHLEGRQFVLGDDFSMGDIPLGAGIHKFFTMDIKRASLPNIEAWYQRLSTREAYKTHAMNPFGTCPSEWLALEKAGA